VITSVTERVLLGAGLMLMGVWFAGRLHRTISSRTAIAEFQAQHRTDPSAKVSAPLDSILGVPADLHLWSAKRIAAYEDSLAKKTDGALGILRIPKISLEAPIFNDTDDLTLNRGVGRIQGTAQVGTSGNVGIAGHRDGFFRGLQNVGPGDVVEVVQPRHSDRYVVTQLRIVKPEDTWVLNPTVLPTLTLVTCFPFYYVGHAPNRYIVTAVLIDGVDDLQSRPTKTQDSRAETKNIRRRTHDLN
jgi:sortase A